MTTQSEYKYHNFKQGVTGSPNLLTQEEINAIPKDNAKDYYTSIFRYTDEHKRQALDTKSIKGIKDVRTNKLVWDFDDATSPENARQDVLALATRLNHKYDIGGEEMAVYFSGNKGFHFVVTLEHDITQEQFKNITSDLAKDLKTYDSAVNDPQRLLRLEHTKNLKSGLYKIPLTIDKVAQSDMNTIKDIAKDSWQQRPFITVPVSLPKELFKEKPKKQEKTVPLPTHKFDVKSCPKGWKSHKWALAEGWFEAGEREQALMVVAATSRALGYSKEHTYYLCKAALKKQAERTGQEEFSKEELYKNIIEDSVFADGWQGGAYGADNIFIQNYCKRMGFTLDEKEDLPSVPLDTLIDGFINFSTNFEQNIIPTGVPEIDANLLLCVGTLNGLLGQPGSGKTTVAMEILKNTSLAGIPSMFFSLDMGPQIVFAKVVQKESGHTFKDAMRLYREGGQERDNISTIIKTKYKHVGFNFKCGSTVADLKKYIIEQRERTGVALKFIVVDYLELISGPYSDPTANAAVVVHELKNLATEEDVCILLLLQTQKHSTPDIADPLLSMKQIKGASAIEQDCSTVLTLWREGYNPKHVQFDKYISFAIVKNRFDSLWEGDFRWFPVQGTFRSLSDEERADLEEFKKRKKAEKTPIKDWE